VGSTPAHLTKIPMDPVPRAGSLPPDPYTSISGNPQESRVVNAMTRMIASKRAATTLLRVTAASYSKRQPTQASDAADIYDDSVIGGFRSGLSARRLMPPSSAGPVSLADYRRSLATKPSRRPLNCSIVTAPSFRVGSRKVSDLQFYRFSCLYRRLFSTILIYRCWHQ
jgi:hypothetical protein